MKKQEDWEASLQRLSQREDIQKLAQSPEGQRLGSMVDAKSMERALQKGDSRALQEMLSKLLHTEEGQRLAEQVQRTMQEG